MSNYMEGRRYGWLSPSNDGGFYKGIQHQQVAGYSVGILYIENINYPIIPGNVVNACTYPFPVRMKAVRNLTNERLFNNDPTIVDDIVSAARSLAEDDGCRAICSACGFFGNYQQQVRSALNIPVAMSSLVQIPFILSMIRPEQKIAVISANGASMTDSLLESCGVKSRDRLVIMSARNTPNFANAVVDNAGYFDNDKARDEVVALAAQAASEHSDVGAILLECSDMPPYAAAIQSETQLPVFDFITLIRWLNSGVAQKPYSGWV